MVNDSEHNLPTVSVSETECWCSVGEKVEMPALVLLCVILLLDVTTGKTKVQQSNQILRDARI